MNRKIVSMLALFAAMLFAGAGHAATGTIGTQSATDVQPLMIPLLLPAIGGTFLPPYVLITVDTTLATGYQAPQTAHAEVKSDIICAFVNLAADLYVIPRSLLRFELLAVPFFLDVDARRAFERVLHCTYSVEKCQQANLTAPGMRDAE